MNEATPSQQAPKLTVVRSAILRAPDTIFSLPQPNGCGDVMRMIHEQGLDPIGPDMTEGFVLSDGTFADRTAALKVALAAGQVERSKLHAGALDILLSIDLW